MKQTDILHDLARKGFLAEIVTDAWADWKFKDDKPDYNTANPANLQKDPNHVCWRGCFMFFDKRTNKLIQDDVGCFYILDGGAETALKKLMRAYTDLKEYINPKGFFVEEQ